jgi:hypothetical protein
MIITKLDGRYSGWHVYPYMIEPSKSYTRHSLERRSEFLAWRAWFWEAFGPGMERDFAVAADEKPVWAWYSENSNFRIYVTEPALTIFKLKWA